jgi:hypothetical protein
MELLGQTLEELMTYCDQVLSLKSVILIADQLVSREINWTLEVLDLN